MQLRSVMGDHVIGELFGGTNIEQFMDCTEFHTLEMDAEVLKVKS
jgi:hypothetical protein